MSQRVFHILVLATGIAFAVIFAVVVVPALWADGDVVGAFGAGFVNPYASGYAWDTILCWVVLVVWIVYERGSLDIRHGWLCVLLGVVPGVAVGFALYLVLRSKQLSQRPERLA